MKRVGILTFFFADNYGAVLQTFALRHAINSLEGFQAEIIPFVPYGYQPAKYWHTDSQYQFYVQKRRKFDKFMHDHCGMEGDFLSIVEGNKYDIYCIGSDQVWNKKIMNSDEYFFPHLDENAYRISYASSVGVLPDSVDLATETMTHYLPKFKYVSVREYEHVPFIEQIINRKCECVLDPTLLLDTKDYEVLIDNKEQKKKPFIFFFWLVQDDGLEKRAIEFVNTVARKYQLAIVHNFPNAARYMFYGEEKNMYFEGVENYLWYMKNADFVVTNSYHAMVFAIQFKKPFYTFIFAKLRTRIDTLAKRLGLESRLVEHSIDVKDINNNIDYNSVNEKLSYEQECAYNYLKRALGAEYGENI